MLKIKNLDYFLRKVSNLFDLKSGKKILESIKNELGTKYTCEQYGQWVENILNEINGSIKTNN